MTLRAVFRLALRQTEGLIGSIIRLLGLDLAVPDHSTLSRRAETLQVVRPVSSSTPVHLLVDSTGLRLCGPGEWLVEKHGARTRRSWKKLHLSVDVDTGEIVAAALTSNDADDGSQVGPLLDQIGRPVASFTGDGAFDRDDVYGEVAGRHPDAPVIVPPRSSAVPSAAAETVPTQRDEHLKFIAEHGRMGWQKTSGYNYRALVEADISRYKRVIGDTLRSRTDARRATTPGLRRVQIRSVQHGVPEGQYGAGEVATWDRGTWEPIGDPEAAMRKGDLQFVLHGTRLNGRFHLVRLNRRERSSQDAWFLIKRHDEHERPGIDALTLEAGGAPPAPPD